MSELNLMLYRPLRSGKEYDKLFEPNACESVYVGKGMTDFSMDSMAELITQFNHQTAKVAPRLKGKTLQETCTLIHDFLYWHFQYHADTAKQQLRKPACSWAQRRKGIDCKSYSILASSILTNLQIPHYLRRVKQPGLNPTMWTHVYVVVPINQQNAALAEGYFIIDGTVLESTETPFTQKDDLLMSMEHYWLGQPAAQNGLNLPSLASIKNAIFSGKFSFSSLSCIGGSMDDNAINKVLPAINAYFTSAYDQVNSDVRNNSFNLLNTVNKLIDNANKLNDHSAAFAAHNWKSACSKAASRQYNVVGQYYLAILQQAFYGWLKNYFDVSFSSITTKNAPMDWPDGGTGSFLHAHQNRNVTYQRLSSIKMKSGVTEIRAFDFGSPYILDAAQYQNGSFNTAQMLDSLTQVLATFGVKTGNGNTAIGGGTTPGVIVDPNNNLVTIPKNEPKSAGLGTAGWVIGGLAVGGIAYGIMKSKGIGLGGRKPKTVKKVTKYRRK